MKVPGAAKILISDAVLLALLYLVQVDLVSRNTYANSLNFASSTGYSVLTHVMTLTGGGTRTGTTLVSPLTLDWTQLLIVALVVLTLSYGFRLLRTPRTRPETSGVN